MAIQQIIDYITMHLDLGENKDQIKHALLLSGWQEAKVDEAFASRGGYVPETIRKAVVFGYIPKNVSSDRLTPRAPLSAHLPSLDSGGESARQQRGRRKRNTVVPMLFGMMLGVVILFGTAFGFWHFVLSNRQSPEEILLISMQKMVGIQSYGISGNADLTTDDTLLSWLPFLQVALPSSSAATEAVQSPDAKPAGQTATKFPDGRTILVVSGDGVSDSRDPKHPQGFFSLHVQADSPADRIKAKIGIDARIDGETIYFKLNDVDLSNTSLAILSRFASRWIQGNVSSLMKEYSASAALEPALPTAGDDVAKRTDEARANQRFSPQELSRLASIFNQTKPLLVTQFPEASEGGIAFYHMGVAPQGEGMKEFLLAALDVFKQNSLPSGKAATPQGEDSLAIRKKLEDPSFSRMVDQFAKQSTIELWIDKTDFLLRRAFSRFHFEDGTTGEITLTMSGYNQDVPVTIPGSSTPIEQVIQEFSASFAPTEQTVKP